MKTILKSLYSRCSFITRPLYGGAGYILMFHRVCPPGSGARLQDNLGMEVTPDHLEAIIRFFRERHFDFISPDQLVERLPDKKIRKKFVVFTFDDGYADNLHHAYPLFKKQAVPFTIYVTASFPERQAILWWYILEDLLLEREELSIKTGNPSGKFPCRSFKEKEEAFRQIRTLIMNVPAADHPAFLHDLFDPFGLDLYRKTAELALSWGQIRQLSQDPLVTIGAHTVNHQVLSQLSPREARKEIEESKRSLENHLQQEVRHFAYPFGGREEAGEREFDLVKETGFKTGVTTRFAAVFRQHRHHLERLPRIFVPHGTDDRFLQSVINGTLTGLANRFKRVVTTL
jgi:peptidoglycan/xylan/chitin deacetylase (PgdA/CDA1 family)